MSIASGVEMSSILMRALTVMCFTLCAFSTHAQGLETRLALGKQLVQLMRYEVMFESYLRECRDPSGTAFDPVVEFRNAPSAFGGISPQSKYWSEVVAVYRRLQEAACTYMTADNFAAFYAEWYAKNATEEELRAAIAYFNSPAGQKIQAISVQANDAFQAFASKLMTAAYKSARRSFQKDLDTLIERYRAQPQ
jgi:hypothetical protein